MIASRSPAIRPVTVTSVSSYTGFRNRHVANPRSSHSRPHVAIMACVAYAYTSTPGTKPPENPNRCATVSSWMRFSDAFERFSASTR